MEKTHEYYQEKIELTPKQMKAWKSLERAMRKCKKENIYFYQVLETLYGLNGHNVKTIDDWELYGRRTYTNENANLQTLAYPSVYTVDSLADDTHFVILKEEIE